METNTASVMTSAEIDSASRAGAKAPRYVLRVTPKGSKFFHEVIDTESMRVIGTRTSNRHYRFATIVRDNLDGLIEFYRELQENPAWLNISTRLKEYERMKADGIVPAPGVYSFNSKPTPVSPKTVWRLTQIAIATEI